MTTQQLTLEQTELNIGIVALTDCAPLVMARQLGYFEKFGLKVNLHIQHSWATVRDRLQAGLLDAAQMLAPMPIAISLGLNGSKTDIISAFNLSMNGNGITLSRSIIEQIIEANNGELPTLPLDATWLKNIIEKRQQQGLSKLRFAAVYPFSCHYYQLQDWLETAGVNVVDDIEVIIIPPANMTQALENEEIDGFCVGTPWNTKAVRSGIGGTVITSKEIWQEAPEKVLAVTQKWQEQNPNTFLALLAATQLACNWLNSNANRFEAATVLSQSEYLDEPVEVVAPSLIGSCLTFEGFDARELPAYIRFYKDNANEPDIEQGKMLLGKMKAAGQLQTEYDEESLLQAIYRPDIYSEAMKLLAD